ncbi:MAG: DnaB-like helicase C-terminal domain-containing protein [Bacilli bacterium]
MRPFEAEQLLLKHIVQFGNDAARVCLPQLTPEKFCFALNGNFGTSHSLIWSEIRRVYLKDNLSPTLNVLKSYIGQEEYDYLDALPHLTALDIMFVEQLTNVIDKQGLVYNVSKYGHTLGSIIQDTEHFMQTLDSITDIEAWTSDKLDKLRNNVSIQSDGYEHVSTVGERVKQEWDELRSGKRSAYIDSGIPILKNNYLFPTGEITVIHGLSGSGKSTFVFQVLLGTAIGLYLNNKPGCVAINSLEMTSERLVERLAGILAHVDLTKLKTGQMSTAEYDRLLEWLGFVSNMPIFVDDTSFLSTTALQYRASGLHVSKDGPVVQLASDYGELFREDDSNLSKEQRIDKVFREQFYLSRMIGASIIAISQSTVDTAISGRSYIAGADGTRYSKAILQAADGLCELWNPEQIEKAGRKIVLGEGSSLTKDHPYLLVQKRRSGSVGESIPFGWNAPHVTFFDMSLPQTPDNETIYTTLEAAVNKRKGITSTW